MDEDTGSIKYSGSIIPYNCSCPSYIQNNTEKYESSHPEPFLCKHILRGIEVKKMQDSQENRLRASIKEREDKRVIRGTLPKNWSRYEYE